MHNLTSELGAIAKRLREVIGGHNHNIRSNVYRAGHTKQSVDVASRPIVLT